MATVSGQSLEEGRCEQLVACLPAPPLEGKGLLVVATPQKSTFSASQRKEEPQESFISGGIL